MKSCVPVFVDCVEKDEDADENVERRSDKHGKTCEWTIHGFVHTARGHRH